MRRPALALLSLLAGAGAAASEPTAPGLGGDRELGAYLAATCVGCHQASGRQAAGVPAITGWPEPQFVAVMRSYREGERDNAAMGAIARGLAEDEVLALAAYFGALPAAH